MVGRSRRNRPSPRRPPRKTRRLLGRPDRPRPDLFELTDDLNRPLFLAMLENLADETLPLRPGILPALWIETLDRFARGCLETPEAFPEQTEVACQIGCSFCCRQPVGVHALGAFTIAWVIRQAPRSRQDQVLQRLQDSITATEGLDGDALATTGRACPFLTRGSLCGIHRYRPIACHNSQSSDAQACEDALVKMVRTRQPQPYPGVRGALTELGTAHLRAAWLLSAQLHLQDELYDLARAVWIAWEDPGSESRWLAGEDVLAPASLFRHFPDFLFGESPQDPDSLDAKVNQAPRGFAVVVRDGQILPIGL